jgi:hypothetical protein
VIGYIQCIFGLSDWFNSPRLKIVGENWWYYFKYATLYYGGQPAVIRMRKELFSLYVACSLVFGCKIERCSFNILVPIQVSAFLS